MPRTKFHGNPPEKKKIGAPSSYDPEVYPRQAYIAVSKMGATNEMMAAFFNVSTVTIAAWQKGHPEFLNAIKAGRDEYDSSRVKKSLLRRAMGYEYDEVRRENIMIKQGKGKVAIPAEKITVTRKMVQPSDVAIFFWLCNRQPTLWKNVSKQIIEVDGKFKHDVEHKYNLRKLGRQGLEQLRGILDKARVAADADARRSGPGASNSQPPRLCPADVARN